MDPKYGRQIPKFAHTTVKTVLCVKFVPQKCNISCLFSKVWQNYNVKVTLNVIAQKFDNCTYLHGLQTPKANSKIYMYNVDVN